MSIREDIITKIYDFLLFFIGNAEMEKVAKSLNAQNYDMAVTKLKEIIYDDEEKNLKAYGLFASQQRRRIQILGIGRVTEMKN